MGKYVATKGIQRNKAWRSVGNGIFGNVSEEGDYRFKSFLYGADPTGLYRGYVTSRDSTAYMRDYLKNRGLDWSDIRYLTRTPGFGSDGRFASSMITVSANIARLYI